MVEMKLSFVFGDELRICVFELVVMVLGLNMKFRCILFIVDI